MQAFLLATFLLVLDMLEVVGPCSPFLHMFMLMFLCDMFLAHLFFHIFTSSTAHTSLLTFLPHASCRFQLILLCLLSFSRLTFFPIRPCFSFIFVSHCQSRQAGKIKRVVSELSLSAVMLSSHYQRSKRAKENGQTALPYSLRWIKPRSSVLQFQSDLRRRI